MKVVDQSVKLIDKMGSDLSVVNAARVSFHKESAWENQEDLYEPVAYIGRNLLNGSHEEGVVVDTTVEPQLSAADTKLISYLAKHNHFTPFTHAILSFRMKAPIFMARQLLRHVVGLSVNETSRRYVSDEPEFFMPESWRGKPVNAKQGSSDVIIDQMDCEPDYSPDQYVRPMIEQMLGVYEELLASGVAPEQARMVLPQNMMTEWIWTGSLAAFARIYKLRIDAHAQVEVQDIAKKIAAEIPTEMSVSWQALTAT